jgi:hypothetical protein
VPELGERLSGDLPLADAILSDVQYLSRKISPELALGSIADCRWPALSRGDAAAKPQNATDGSAMLGSAAVMLIHEMLRRLPLGNDPAALATWQRHARALGGLFAYLGLWRLLRTKPFYPAVLGTIRKLLPQATRIAGLQLVQHLPPEISAGLALYLLFVDGPSVDDKEEIDTLIHEIVEWRFHRGVTFPVAGYRSSATDPIAHLCRIPLPQQFESFLERDFNSRASLYHAVTAFVGSPATILKFDDQNRRGLLDLVLFASASIVGPPDADRPLSYSGYWWWRGDQTPISPAHRAAIQGVADIAWRWLADHLPAIAFPTSLEEKIESASGLRYVVATHANSE